MSITIHASFVVDSFDDLHECLAFIRENEPASLSFEGDLTMTYESEATPYRMGAGPGPEVHEWTELAADATPAHGVVRP